MVEVLGIKVIVYDYYIKEIAKELKVELVDLNVFN